MKGARNRAKRAVEAAGHEPQTEVEWLDILDFHGIETIPGDYVVGETYLLNPEDTEGELPIGPPVEIYRDYPEMFRLWLAREMPDWVCDGDGCVKLHPHLAPGTVCHGNGVRTKAIDRVSAEITRRFREDNPGRKPTPAYVLAYLKETQ